MEVVPVKQDAASEEEEWVALKHPQRQEHLVCL